MCEVINLVEYKKKKQVSGVVKGKVVVVELPDDMSERIERIKASINRINQLMNELGDKK